MANSIKLISKWMNAIEMNKQVQAGILETETKRSESVQPEKVSSLSKTPKKIATRKQ